MTSQPAKTRRSRFMLYAVIGVILLIGLYISARYAYESQAPADKIITAIRFDFPTFCTGGQILDELLTNNPTSDPNNHDHFWGIKCDSWLKSPGAFYGDALILDADTCTTVRPPGTLGVYYSEFEALNTSNGQKLAVCP
jgi:hypothetical protein